MATALKRIPLGILATITLITLSTYAADKNTVTKTTGKNDPVVAQTWYDGERAHTSWMSPHLVAEFNSKDTTSAVKHADPSATEHAHAKSSHVKIWETQHDARELMAQTKAKNPTAQMSPVFYDSPAPGGRMRALPGNIIVTLDPRFTPAQVETWIKQNGVQLVRPLTFAPNTLLIRTDAGLAALDAATRLRGVSGVVRVSPEWWQEISTR